MNIVIPMAGLGQRFKIEGFTEEKPLIELMGKSLIEHSIESLNIEGNFIFVTRKYRDSTSNHKLSEILKRLKPNSIEIQLTDFTSGAVETALAASHLINNDEELIITNCDQRLEWDSDEFINFINNDSIDGCVVTFDSDNPKNSFAEIAEDGFVTRFVEKEAISRNALIGLHYWRKGSDFVESAEKLFKIFKSQGKKECYISESYNFLIENKKKIKCYEIHNNEFISLGTPYDLSIFQAKIKEFYIEKPKTIFCDIDGTILSHLHRFSDVASQDPKILENVLNKFNEWDSQGNKIILCTARKESAREITERHLKDLGLCWDQLIMGLTSGPRVLINDKLNKMDPDRSISINLTTNEGFGKLDWKKYKL
jgi:NDP-sugar pyrophosphorylase family protein